MRIAICVEKGDVFGLLAWRRAIQSLESAGHSLVGVWGVRRKLGNYEGLSVFFWYLSTFGLWEVAKLSFFSISVRLRNVIALVLNAEPTSYRLFAKKYGVPFFETSNPNSDITLGQLRNVQPDIIFIMQGFIVRSEFLKVAKVAVLNKHAAVLPSNRGLFPYIWALLNEVQQGNSIHIVTEGIDLGPVIYREVINSDEICRSMISFYFYIFSTFADPLIQVLSKLAVPTGPSHLVSDVRSSYFSLPSRRDFKKFKEKDGKLICFADFATSWTRFHSN